MLVVLLGLDRIRLGIQDASRATNAFLKAPLLNELHDSSTHEARVAYVQHRRRVI